MQKVERKKHRSRRKSLWLAAAAVLLAGSVAAAVLLKPEPEQIPEREDRSGMLIARAADELVSVTVQRRGEEPWTMVRTADGQLEPEAGGEWTVAEEKGRMLQEGVTQLRYEEILTEDPEAYRNDLGSFGLEDPMVTVTARYTDGQQVTLKVGNKGGPEESWYYLTAEGDDRLYAVSTGIAEELDVEYALLHPVPKPEIYEALLDRITVTDGNGKRIAEWTLLGEITDRDAGTHWAVTAPFTYPADEESIASLKKSAANLRLGIYTARATEANLEQYGLKVPAQILEFHMAAGSTGTVSESGVYDVSDHEERTVQFFIGSARDDMADYVRFGDEIYTVSHFTLAAFTEPNPENSTARYPVLIPLASLESLTIEENGEKKEYILWDKETLEGDIGNTQTGEETRECLLNGEAVDYAAFEAAYDRLLTVTFSGRLPDGASWKEPYKKYTFHTRSGGTHTVSLCDWDGMHDAVTVDGSTRFYLIKGGMTELPDQSR